MKGTVPLTYKGPTQGLAQGAPSRPAPRSSKARVQSCLPRGRGWRQLRGAHLARASPAFNLQQSRKLDHLPLLEGLIIQKPPSFTPTSTARLN